MSDAHTPPARRPPRPVMGPRLRRLLGPVLGLFGLLAVNGAYLGTVTFAEWLSGDVYQDFLYQVMFLAHLVLGLLLIVPALAFGALHLRNAWGRPNRAAVRAGLGLYTTAVLLLVSGVVLTRFDFFEVRDPEVRAVAYWLHVASPLVVAWLFVLHRLAGRPIRWRVGAAWAGVAVAFSLAMLLVQAPAPGRRALDEASYAGDAFRPSLAKTADGGLIPARVLMMDAYCEACHADVHRQWSASAHRMSSFNNPAYRFSVRETREVTTGRGSPRAARFCAACHDPVPLFSGAFDDPEFDDVNHPTANAGITCTACHAITALDSPRGNGDYTVEAPVHYPFAYSESPVLQWVNHQLVKAKPAFHKKTFLKPLHRQPELCGACHKVHLPREVNGYKWLRGQNHYDSFLLSGASGHGAMSFYYPERAVPTCGSCHMPAVESDDFGARDLGGGRLQVHDHQFRGANTALPHLLGLPGWVNEAHREYLEGAVRVDLFGVKRGGTITGELVAPLRPEVPALEPGRDYLLEVVLRNLRVGHLFTQGTADSNEVWLDVTVSSGGRTIGRSGGSAEDGAVDPWAHFANAYILDREGRRIDRRNAHDIFTALYDHQIPPGAADVVHYALRVPEDAAGSLTVDVALRYRKFDTAYLRHFQGEGFAGNDLPVTVLGRDSVTFPIAGAGPAAEAGPAPAPAWERWNDYGIGLLRKGQRGELRQAEAAFAAVERAGRPDGPLNLARVYLREGRLEDASAALRRAASHEPPAYPWLVAWLSAQVNLQNGFLDEAIADLRRVVTTDFAEARRRGFDFGRDYRVRNELGQALFERAKQARGDGRRAEREALLAEAVREFEAVLDLDPENLTAHYNLALVYTLTGDGRKAEAHRALHEQYRPDDNAREVAVTRHRRENPAADHAAEAVVVYDLQRPGAPGLPLFLQGPPRPASGARRGGPTSPRGTPASPGPASGPPYG